MVTKQAASSILDTGIKMVRNVGSFNFGRGAIAEIAAVLRKKPAGSLRDKQGPIHEIGE